MRALHADRFRDGSPEGDQLASDGGMLDQDHDMLNLTNLSDVINGGTRDTLSKAGKGNKSGKTKKQRDHMYQFVEWNFQKRQRKEKTRLRKDHPCFPIITRLLERFNQGKEIKDLMSVKSAARYIYNIYMGKAAEFAQEKQANKKPARQEIVRDTNRSVSPEQPE